MALVRCDFFSEVLGVSTSMTVILPQASEGQIGMAGAGPAGDAPVLYLLHGLSDDCTIWLRRTSVERYVADLGLAVVMPQVDRSMYVDEHHGNRYGTFLTEELPEIVQGFFRVSPAREGTFVAGLSMGGYGAMRWALSRPERFAAAASLSGVLDVAALHESGERDELYRRVYGPDPVRGTENDLLALLERADPAALPALYACCGTEDPLFDGNQVFAQKAEQVGAPLTYTTGPGEHEWGYWDEKIQDVLAWLPLRRGSGA
ncbi:alpha/beta hydrolase [Georgenia subflava]|uniref:Prolyl oligopeptidase family serine peptidase n=1 Tax=Georgenia subflava TaxID=1622177 RepID=A0A6N7EH92_9MICO|nr:alpha/beta hydrolase family protein [Georgenia subflava]MPV36781.1 prolyl oligopeptidase family serine peptidase [Georgenia subflava]